jgi:MFS family permease
MGIGGEYAAINSAIDELIPARYRGRVDIAVNGTYWGGALMATVLTLLGGQPPLPSVLLVAGRLPVRARRSAFVILFVRKNLPESPRWLLMHGRVEQRPRRPWPRSKSTDRALGAARSAEVDESKAIEITPASNIGFIALARTLFVVTRSGRSSGRR